MDKIAEEKIKKDIEKLLKAKKKQSIKWGYVEYHLRNRARKDKSKN